MAAIHNTPLDAASKGLLRGAMLFDIYRAKTSDASMAQDEKSLGVRLTLGHDEQTLQDSQIEVITSAITAHLTAQLNARLR
jgi:phenylalanyl-tRNA synthetase beta chain